MRVLAGVGLFLLWVVSVGCSGPASQCTASTCGGCCDSAGICQLGSTAQACGTFGQACVACGLGLSCNAGFCSGGAGGGGGSCVPATCMSLGKNCGTLSDGCGGTLSCGTCEVSGESCGGAGTANVCGPGTCNPKSCTDLGANCGQPSDGCGALLSCGSCTAAGDTCGGGGTAFVCGQGACVAKSCGQLGFNCGMHGDGCSGTVDCGGCAVSGDTCGGGGTPGICGHGSCVPQSCGTLGKNCGMVDDGCGNQQSCGSCTGLQTCGGGGTANVCGAMCVGSCPSGFSCNSDGACAGGNLQTLVLDVPVPPQYTVSGNVTRNGAAPTVSSCYYVGGTTGYAAASLSFKHATDSRYDTSVYVPCSNCTSSTFAFSAQLYPGTYTVTVPNWSGYSTTNLPAWDTVVNSTFSVSSAQSGVVFDVTVPPQYTVSGNVTRNGATPTVSSCYYVGGTTGYAAASLSFKHATDSRYDTSVYVPCSNSTSSTFAFSAQLYPGTYTVTVPNWSGYSTTNLPAWDTVVNSTFSVSSAQSGVVFNVTVPPQYTVSGNVTRNGATPTVSSCYYVGGTTGYAAASLSFKHATDSRYDTSVYVPCSNSTSSTFAFSAQLYPGTYTVTVPNWSGYSTTNLPAWDTVVNSNFSVSSAQSGVVFDVSVPPQYTVSGNVTRNGATPTVSSCYYVGGTTGYAAASLSFKHATDSRYDTSVYVPCSNSTSSTFAFSAQLYPGTYTVTVPNWSGYSTTNLPAWDTVVNSNFSVSSAQSGVVFDVTVPPQYTVSGNVTRNGATPTVSSCYYVGGTTGYAAASLSFKHATDSRFDTSVYVPCSNSTSSTFAFSAQLYPGNYTVTVPNWSGYSTTNLPAWDTVVNSTFSVSSAQSGVVFDVPVPPQYTVSGTLTRNGATPTVSSCYYVGGTTGYAAASLSFKHLTDSRYDASTYVPCSNSTSSTFNFTVLLYPGVYEVTVPNWSGYSTTNLPAWDTVVVNRLQVP